VEARGVEAEIPSIIYDIAYIGRQDPISDMSGMD
jgi:hypothetical protein